jgi:aldose 1-epimerase
MTIGTADATTATKAEFGRDRDGQPVEAVTFVNGHGMHATVISYGASVQSVLVPDAKGSLDDVALGYPSMDGYLNQPQYLGSTVGRVANRIAKGRFTLDGKSYQTPVNNGPNALHGGAVGFDKRNWRLVDVASGPTARAVFELVSADGDQGYPGTLTVRATYTLGEDNALGVEYRATTDRATIVQLSNHSYWNLAGEGQGSAMDHLLTIPAQEFTPVDKDLIPTGEFRKVDGTVFDFRKPTPVGARVRDASDEQIRFGRGYDHNWVISRRPAPAPRLVARVEDPRSRRVMEVLSDQPGLQFYSGNFLDATTAGKAGRLYRMGDTIVLEPQLFPDTVNRPEFGSARLDPGQTYLNRIIFRFSVAK